jgi:hypothetical protein
MNVKRVVVCADDFGLSPGVSRGILELLEMGRLSATSCMVDYPEFRDYAQALQSFRGHADLGLHFSLTGSRSIASVALECHLRPPALTVMLDEMERQLAKFTDAMAMLPDYIDGHQHVHVLPVVRDAVMQVAKRIGAYVRVPCDPIGVAMWRRPAPFESFYLSRASRSLAKLTRATSIPTNNGFRGPRTFKEKQLFGALFRRMITGAEEGCLIMCHPGHADAALIGRDPIHEARSQEWNYFAGPEYLVDLENAGLTLSRLREAIPSAH